MPDDIFRKKSLDRIQSPENLNDYVRVVNPGVWMLLAAAILLLIGALVWGVFGRLDTTVSADAKVENGVALCCVYGTGFHEEQTVRIEGESFTVSEVRPAPADAAYTAVLTVPCDLPNGTYSAEVVVASERPISFLL